MSVKSIAVFFVALLGCAPAFCVTENQPSRAREYVQAAVSAMGGEAVLRSIHTVRMDYRGHGYLLEQSERPEGPWLVSYENGSEYRDYDHRAFRQNRETQDPGSPDRNAQTLTVADGVAQAKIGDRDGPGTSAQVDDVNEWLTFAPEQILLHALSDAGRDLHAEADVSYHNEPHHVVFLRYEGMPVRLYFNVWTRLLSSVEWVHAHPSDIFWRIWGDVTHRCDFTFYFLLPGGARLPLQWDFIRNGQPYRTVTVTKLEINPKIPDGTFTIAPEVKTAFEQRRSVMQAGPPLGKPSPLVEGDNSLVGFVGAWNSAIISQPDGLVILEAPIGPAHTQALLAEAAKRYPGVAVKAVITTSDSWPHFAGIREVVANGIPIYATDLNQPILTRAVNAPYTQSPDKLAGSPVRPKFHWVSGKTVIGSGPNRLELFPIRNASGERMMMVYLPERKLLYVSDLAQRMPDGSYFMPEYLHEVAEAVAREKLVVEKFFAMHTRLTPWSDLQRGIAETVRPAGEHQ